MAGDNWFIRIGDDEVGPLTEAELQELVTSGVVVATTLVSEDGETWRYASKTPDLEVQPGPATRQSTPPTTPPPNGNGGTGSNPTPPTPAAQPPAAQPSMPPPGYGLSSSPSRPSPSSTSRGRKEDEGAMAWNIIGGIGVLVLILIAFTNHWKTGSVLGLLMFIAFVCRGIASLIKQGGRK